MAFVRSVCTRCERVAILREEGVLVILGFTVLRVLPFRPPARTILSWAGRPQNNSAAEVSCVIFVPLSGLVLLP